MKIQEFIDHHEKLNDAETKKYWTYAEDYVFVEHYEWEYKIEFLGQYNNVIGRAMLWDLLVDENIWLIVTWCDTFISKELLDRLEKIKEYKEIDYIVVIDEYNKMMNEITESLKQESTKL